MSRFPTPKNPFQKNSSFTLSSRAGVAGQPGAGLDGLADARFLLHLQALAGARGLHGAPERKGTGKK